MIEEILIGYTRIVGLIGGVIAVVIACSMAFKNKTPKCRKDEKEVKDEN